MTKGVMSHSSYYFWRNVDSQTVPITEEEHSLVMQVKYYCNHQKKFLLPELPEEEVGQRHYGTNTKCPTNHTEGV